MNIKIRNSSLVLALGLFAAGCAQVMTPVSPQAQLAAIGDGFQVDGFTSPQVARLREAALKLGNVCLVTETVLTDPEYNSLFCVWERGDTNSASAESESVPEPTTEVTSVDEPMDEDYPDDQTATRLQ